MVEETHVQKKGVLSVLVVKMVKKNKVAKQKGDKHPWDETMVIAVLVVAALSILIILASYITVTGAAYSTIPSREGSLEQLERAVIVEGNGKAKCSIMCKDIGKVCFVAHANDDLALCDDKITGDYHCTCTNTEKII
jgi:hypothetical protein